MTIAVFYLRPVNIFVLFDAAAVHVSVLFALGAFIEEGVNIFKNVLSKHDVYEGYVNERI